MRRRVELCLHRHHLVAERHDAAAHGAQSARAVFERLFGEADTTDAAARLARLAARRSLLDSVADSIADLRRGLGTADASR